MGFSSAIAADPQFRFEEKKGESINCFYGDKPIWRFETPTHDPKRHTETYKPFLQIYDFEGKNFLTKGAGGKFTHHRGVFFGYNKVKVGEKTYDLWHMGGGVRQQFSGISELSYKHSTDVEPFASQIDWQLADGTKVIRESRLWETKHPAPTERQMDFVIKLTSLAGPLRLDGDLQHAGFHFRAALEVEEHEKDRPATYILPPDYKGDQKAAEKDAPTWGCMLFQVGGKKYGAMMMNHPDNSSTKLAAGGGKYQLSTRAYGRFGFFSPYDLVPEKPLSLRYRLYIFDATQKPDAKALDAKYREYVK